jgi:hypothetical protein
MRCGSSADRRDRRMAGVGDPALPRVAIGAGTLPRRMEHGGPGRPQLLEEEPAPSEQNRPDVAHRRLEKLSFMKPGAKTNMTPIPGRSGVSQPPGCLVQHNPKAAVIVPPRITAVAGDATASQRDKHLTTFAEHGCTTGSGVRAIINGVRCTPRCFATRPSSADHFSRQRRVQRAQSEGSRHAGFRSNPLTRNQKGRNTTAGLFACGKNDAAGLKRLLQFFGSVAQDPCREDSVSGPQARSSPSFATRAE